MHDFGRAQLLEPQAIGEPGQRTFRLRVLSGGQSASLWLEKEHLIALTMAIRQVLEQLPGSEVEPDADPPAPSTMPDEAEVEFKIGRLGIGYDEGKRMVLIYAYTVEDEEDAPPSFSCGISARQCQNFAQRAEEVISGGRPVCPICETPIDPEGHKCLRRNGHADQPLSRLDD